MSQHTNKGFTIVELVIVIVVVGILAAVVISRMASPSAFNAIGARNAIISTAASAQQMALGRNNVTFEIDPSGNDWILTAREGGNAIYTNTVSGGNIILETGSTANLGNCSNAYNDPVTSAFIVTYDRSGNASGFTNSGPVLPVQNGVRLCINNDVQFSVCISPGGYAHGGNCAD